MYTQHCGNWYLCADDDDDHLYPQYWQKYILLNNTKKQNYVLEKKDIVV